MASVINCWYENGYGVASNRRGKKMVSPWVVRDETDDYGRTTSRRDVPLGWINKVGRSCCTFNYMEGMTAVG